MKDDDDQNDLFDWEPPEPPAYDKTTGTKFYVDHKITWGPGRRTVMLAFAFGAQLSDNDIALRYNMKHKTVSARRCELWRLGFVYPVGLKKITRQSGQIWAATPAGNAEIERLLNEADAA